jgi:phosphate transport system protein
MARTARNIFSEGLDIYKNRDIDRARDLQAKDDKVDLLYSEAALHLKSWLNQKPIV